jgi:hypothetical protein
MAAVAEHRDYLMSETRAPGKAEGRIRRRAEQGEARWVIRLARDRDAMTERRWFGLNAGASNWLWLGVAVMALDQWT